MRILNRFARANVTLAAAVADDGTFTVAYPSGTSQLSFNAGLAGTGHYAILNDNDRWTYADPGINLSFGASEITVTNRSGYSWAAGTTVELFFDRQDGNDVMLLTIPLPLLADITAADVVTEVRPGVYGTIEDVQFVQMKAVTTASKLATLNLEIDTTDVTGGVIALTSATCTPMGKVIAGTAITGNNTLTPESKLSVEASAVTAFSEGSGYLLVRIRRTFANADLA